MTNMERIFVYFTTILCVCALFGHAKLANDTEPSLITVIGKNGENLTMTEELLRKLQEEDDTWHWTPWQRTRIEVKDYVMEKVECIGGKSISSYPTNLFTDDGLRRGGFLLYLLFGVYAFTLLAIVCNDFFVPCVEMICEDLEIPQNVAAATFMSVATSCPEFFVNVISTFISESDMGIGTIVGSAFFNALGVAAIGGLAAITPIAIDMRAVTRDVIIYMVNVSALVVVVWDGQVDWYEGATMGVLYILYFIVMFNSRRLFQLYDWINGKFGRKVHSFDIPEVSEGKFTDLSIDNKGCDVITSSVSNCEKVPEKAALEKELEAELPKKPSKSVWRYPDENSKLYRAWWVYTWLLKFVLGYTIPSPTKYRRFYPLTFLMCIVWIAINSYFVTWSMTVLGYTFFIPDSVMGMTFLAFGGCLPEACSIFIMSRKGEGGIGVSNALGANSLAILFALGLPWFIRNITLIVEGEENTSIYINSDGIDFVVISLLLATACLWISLYCTKFTLKKSLSIVLGGFYLIFITFAILVEMGIILGTAEISFCL